MSGCCFIMWKIIFITYDIYYIYLEKKYGAKDSNLPIEKGRNASLLIKLPLLSRNLSGEKTPGSPQYFSSKWTEYRLVMTIVPLGMVYPLTRASWDVARKMPRGTMLQKRRTSWSTASTKGILCLSSKVGVRPFCRTLSISLWTLSVKTVKSLEDDR